MTSDGSLYGFGRNQNGQLGLGHSNDAVQPVAIQALQVHIPLPSLLEYLLHSHLSHTYFFWVSMPCVATHLASTLCCCQAVIDPYPVVLEHCTCA